MAKKHNRDIPSSSSLIHPSRREFLGGMGLAGGAILSSASVSLSLLGSSSSAAVNGKRPEEGLLRAERCFNIRRSVNLADSRLPIPHNRPNGDEDLYDTKIGNHHKGLPHNNIGEVDLRAYRALRKALASGRPADFERIILGGNAKLSNPQGGLAFDLKGCDSHQTFMPKPPALASAQRAGEMVENYWMALLRDIPFAEYDTSAGVADAVAELTGLEDSHAPGLGGQVSPQTLFRGFTHGDLAGPYVSQFLLQPISFGALSIDQRYWTYLPGHEHLTDLPSWLEAQNGADSFARNWRDSTPRYLRNGRDLAAYVHLDSISQPYLMAAEWLLRNRVPPNPCNPYTRSVLQAGFETFGEPHLLSLLAEAANLALKAVWYHKWFVHRTLRPEEYGGLVHSNMIGRAHHPLHPQVVHSKAIAAVFTKFGTYLLPQAYPEGCPLHPSYGQGHAAIAGACVTILKAFFETEATVFADPVVASLDGLSLIPYDGRDRDRMSLTNELNKLAGNIAMARNFAGVHWRSDYTEALSLGETVALNLLRDERATFNEPFDGFTFSKFDGNKVTA
jgi:hypothetical protein